MKHWKEVKRKDIKRTTCNCSIPKGMKLIGKCKNCFWFAKAKHCIGYFYQSRALANPIIDFNYEFGCWYWKKK